jgi:hypothetical protein
VEKESHLESPESRDKGLKDPLPRRKALPLQKHATYSFPEKANPSESIKSPPGNRLLTMDY